MTDGAAPSSGDSEVSVVVVLVDSAVLPAPGLFAASVLGTVVIVCAAVSCLIITSSSASLLPGDGSGGGAEGMRAGGMSELSSKCKDFLAVGLSLGFGALPVAYNPGIVSCGAAMTPWVSAIGMLASETVLSVAMLLVFVLFAFARNFNDTVLVLSFALLNILAEYAKSYSLFRGFCRLIGLSRFCYCCYLSFRSFSFAWWSSLNCWITLCSSTS